MAHIPVTYKKFSSYAHDLDGGNPHHHEHGHHEHGHHEHGHQHTSHQNGTSNGQLIDIHRKIFVPRAFTGFPK